MAGRAYWDPLLQLLDQVVEYATPAALVVVVVATVAAESGGDGDDADDFEAIEEGIRRR